MLVAGPAIAAALVAGGVGGAIARADVTPASAPGRTAGTTPVRTARTPDVATPSLSQTVGLDVLPGSLSVSPRDERVDLVPVGDGMHLLGRVTVVVVDASGSLGGWQLRADWLGVVDADGQSVPAARVQIEVDRVDVVAGSTTDPIRTHRVVDPHSVLVAAAAGGGGGTFAVHVTVSVDLPNGIRTAPGGVGLAFSLG